MSSDKEIVKKKADEIVSRASMQSDKQSTKASRIQSKAELQAGALLLESDEIRRLSNIAKDFEIELLGMAPEFGAGPNDLMKRTTVLKTLTDTREKIINLRRRNLGINDNSNGDADAPASIDINISPSDAYKLMIGSR